MSHADYWNDTERERAEELAEAEDAARAFDAHRKQLNHKSKPWLQERYDALAMEFIGGNMTLPGEPTKAEFIAGILCIEAAMAADAELAGEPCRDRNITGGCDGYLDADGNHIARVAAE